MLVEAFPDGVMLTDADGMIVLASRRVTDMFGYWPGELAGCPVETLVPAELRSAHRAHRARYARAARIRAMDDRVPLAGLRKDGSVIPVEIALSPVPGPAGPFTLTVIRKAPATWRPADLAGLTGTSAMGANEDTGHEDQELCLLNRIVANLVHVGSTLETAAGPPGDMAGNPSAEAAQRVDATIRDIHAHLIAAHADALPAYPGAPDGDL